MKSATAPYKSLSIALPNAPPITKATNICIKKLVDFLNQIKKTIEIISRLCKQFPNQNFILRPHPFESSKPYEKLLINSNFEIKQTGTSLEWLNGCICLIHFNCSTAIEATMLNKKSISLEWLNTDTLKSLAPPINVSYVPKNEKQLYELEKLDVEIKRCDDYGPSTKLMGSLDQIKNFDCVVILDDDHVYHKEIFEIFINEFKKNKNNYSYYVQKVFKLNMGQGADCILINTDDLDKIEIFFKSFVQNNMNLFLNDDLWISLYLQFIAKNKILNLRERFKQKTNKELVYEIHSNIDSLKDVMKKGFINRRKKAKIEYLKFRIKNYLRSFVQ